MNKHALDIVDAILDRQKQAWLEGSQPTVEDLLRDSALAHDPDILLDLIYNEIVLREELGESPSLEEYTARHPHLQEDLKLHFEVHRALQQHVLTETRPVLAAEPGTNDEPATLEMGPKLKDYTIVGELGRGGMGIVYKALHHDLKRLVALKMFQPGRIPSPRERARFRSEAKAIARLQHPNIVQIHDVGEENGAPFLALELAEHGTLAHRLQELPFAPQAAAELMEALARAIHHAHEHHIVHRDLKPANVLFASDGTPKVTDFGLAKFLQDESDSARDATRTGESIGTPRYMAPEQAAGNPAQIGPPTDVYALGTLLYECLTGQAPFMSASITETMDKIRRDEPLSPRRLQPAIPRDLETICLHCLHKQPGRRYASALALAEDLQRFQRGEPIHARPTPAWERLWKWGRRHPARAALAGVGALVVGAAFVLLVIREHRVAQLRSEVIGLVEAGKQASDHQDDREAKAKFLSALAKTRAEPRLHDLELMIAGWLDHSLRGGEQQRWKQRTPPPLFDERRDEAFLQAVLLDPNQQEYLPAARAAIQAALELTVAGDPAWRREREQLLLLDSDLLLRQGKTAEAFALLDQARDVASRLWHLRRADGLERLGRKNDADAERLRAAQLPAGDVFEFFLSGVDRFHRHDLAGAVRACDQVLDREPDHFAARFLQASCFLLLQRPGEAKVALSACMAQRPHFVWSYLLAGEAALQMGDLVSAAQALQRTLERNPGLPARQRLQQALQNLDRTVAALPEAERNAFWNEKIMTETGLSPLRAIAFLQKMADR